jgi:hypothetical protein
MLIPVLLAKTTQIVRIKPHWSQAKTHPLSNSQGHDWVPGTKLPPASPLGMSLPSKAHVFLEEKRISAMTSTVALRSEMNLHAVTGAYRAYRASLLLCYWCWRETLE